MLQRDYILRFIHQLTEAIRRALAKQSQADAEAGLEALAEGCLSTVGLPPNQLVALPVSGLLQLLVVDGDVDVERGAMLAHVLKVCGDLSSKESAHAFYAKAFCLYDELGKHDTRDHLDPHAETIDALLDKLESSS